MDVAKRFGRFIDELKFESLPPDVVQKAKEEFLDYLGVSFYGYMLRNHLPFLKIFLQENPAGNSTVLGEGKGFTSYQAIFLNSVLAHSTAYESGSRFAAVHPATVVMPVAMVLCEGKGLSGREFITSLVAGYEAMIRIGEAINPSAVGRGFHPTGITGSFGSAATAAKIYNLSALETEASLNIAASQGSGLIRAFDAAGSQPFHCGGVSVAGVLSADLGKSGVAGPLGIITQSYFKAYADDYSPEKALDNLGYGYQIKKTYTKFHGGCRHIHAPIDVVSALVRENDISTDDITKIEVGIYKVAMDFEKEQPATVGDALFSIPFGIALALSEGDAFINHFNEENLSRPDIQKIMQRVELREDPEWNDLYPAKRGCRCEIHTRQNLSYSGSIDFARGEPETPFSPREIKEKYMRLVVPVLGTSRAEKLYSYVQDIDRLDDFSEFMALLG